MPPPSASCTTKNRPVNMAAPCWISYAEPGRAIYHRGYGTPNGKHPLTPDTPGVANIHRAAEFLWDSVLKARAANGRAERQEAKCRQQRQDAIDAFLDLPPKVWDEE